MSPLYLLGESTPIKLDAEDTVALHVRPISWPTGVSLFLHICDIFTNADVRSLKEAFFRLNLGLAPISPLLLSLVTPRDEGRLYGSSRTVCQ